MREKWYERLESLFLKRSSVWCLEVIACLFPRVAMDTAVNMRDIQSEPDLNGMWHSEIFDSYFVYDSQPGVDLREVRRVLGSYDAMEIKRVLKEKHKKNDLLRFANCVLALFDEMGSDRAETVLSGFLESAGLCAEIGMDMVFKICEKCMEKLPEETNAKAIRDVLGSCGDEAVLELMVFLCWQIEAFRGGNPEQYGMPVLAEQDIFALAATIENKFVTWMKKGNLFRLPGAYEIAVFWNKFNSCALDDYLSSLGAADAAEIAWFVSCCVSFFSKDYGSRFPAVRFKEEGLLFGGRSDSLRQAIEPLVRSVAFSGLPVDQQAACVAFCIRVDDKTKVSVSSLEIEAFLNRCEE